MGGHNRQTKLGMKVMFQPKLDNRSDEAMKRCDEALNASLLQLLCQR
jgi:hypothetical protein